MHRVLDIGDFMPEKNTKKQNSRTCWGWKQRPLMCLQEIRAVAHPTVLCTAGGGEQLVAGDLMSSPVIS